MIEYVENSGESMETAIIIKNAPNHFEGVNAEYIYISRKFGVKGKDWKLKQQSLLPKNEKHFDKMEIILSDGTEITIFFDISEFYGKF
ncbi:MAG: hypothetical protein HWN67_01745 [Candidatus Helarchaeota archaeon]|nr:hypothetical protein [Candidatus Helarchaeota archaeon]